MGLNETSETIKITSVIANRWWAVVLRGIAAILFGILTFAAPGTTLLAITVLFGIYAIVDGVLDMAFAWRRAHEGRRWGWLVFEGLVGVGVGIVALAWTEATAAAFLLLIAVWALVTGVAEIFAAIRLRRHIRGEWLLATGGVLSILLGVLMLVFPTAGALVLLAFIGSYAIVFGLVLVALGIRLRAWRGTAEPTVGAVPSPA
ncbi:MAG TPA: HdeD family acid-resistance protein [Enhygromyxa sp.]|nr:HdeD family acid-resistance protein [Enhygromyxa sp.]